MRTDGSGVREGGQRLIFIDNIRWVMIVLVLSMHATDTYSPFGDWYYRDRSRTDFSTGLIFGSYQSILQAFFMGLLFAIAGFFAVPSCDRKGSARFARERCLRLGVPTLLFVCIIGPVTEYFCSHTWGTGGFAHQWRVHLLDGQLFAATGPMWFAAVLLLFSLIYAAVRVLRMHPPTPANSPLSAYIVLGFVLAMWMATFIVRISFPESFVVLNVHPGDFPQYLLMFVAGMAVYRRKWLERWPARRALRLSLMLLLPAVPLFVCLLVFGGALQGDTSRYGGGYNAVSLGKSGWESLVCVGASLLLVTVFRESFARQGRLGRVLADNAFAVYVLHPPIIVLLAILLHPMNVPPVLKAVLLTASGALVAFSSCALMLRWIGPVRRIFGSGGISPGVP